MSAPAATLDQLRGWLQPFLADPPDALLMRLQTYLDLLVRWNARTNLTAVRTPQAMVERHFGESLFAASHVPAGSRTLLDIGSGAGFPGVPIALVRPELQVTLAESQGKKAAFLREALRVLELAGDVWPQRAEAMPPTRRFDVVTLRAVDRPELALAEAHRRVRPGGRVLHLTVRPQNGQLGDWSPIPGAAERVLRSIQA